MPFPFESIMNDTGSTTTKSITSSTKSISIDYEINESVANHCPLRQRTKGDFKLSMVDHLSASTDSTQSKDDNNEDVDTRMNLNDYDQSSLVINKQTLCISYIRLRCIQ